MSRDPSRPMPDGVASHRLGLTLWVAVTYSQSGLGAGIAVASIGAYSVISFKVGVDTQGGVDEPT
ncbi:hypothetical protein D3C78_1298430 [compost metagenome]